MPIKIILLLYFAEFHAVLFRVTEWTLPRHSESRGMSTLFRGVTKSIPSLFRGIFFGTKFRWQPYPVVPAATHANFFSLLFTESRVSGTMLHNLLNWKRNKNIKRKNTLPFRLVNYFRYLRTATYIHIQYVY
jgi:hypothetical protein